MCGTKGASNEYPQLMYLWENMWIPPLLEQCCMVPRNVNKQLLISYPCSETQNVIKFAKSNSKTILASNLHMHFKYVFNVLERSKKGVRGVDFKRYTLLTTTD